MVGGELDENDYDLIVALDTPTNQNISMWFYVLEHRNENLSHSL